MSDKIDLNAPEVKAAVEQAAKELMDKEVGGLKKAKEDLLKEFKEFKDKYEGVDADEFKKLKETAREQGDKGIKDPVEFRKRIEDELKPKIDAAEKRAVEAEAKLKEHVIDAGLTNALVESGVTKEFLPAAKALIKSGRKVDVTDGGAIVDGKPIAAFAKDFAASDEGKHFISAAGNAGGGSRGGGGGVVTGKKIAEMSTAEKASAMKEMGREAYLQQANNENQVKA